MIDIVDHDIVMLIYMMIYMIDSCHDISTLVHSACVENFLSDSLVEVKNSCTCDSVAFSDVIFARPTSSKASTCIALVVFPWFSLSTKHQKTETHLIHHLYPFIILKHIETTNETRTGPNLFILVAVIRCFNLLCLPDIKSRFTTASFFCLSEVTWARISKHFSWLELAPKMTK